jgi:signal transduction histidine kinase/ABC-type nitrate/sulfonate/bicarbonate transport system substrate-binding protein
MVKLLALLFFIIPSLLLAEKNLDKVSLQLHWKYQFEFAGFIAAKEKGFYEEAGLDVELKEYTFGQNIIKDITNKKSTYGIYNSNILVEYLKKEPIQLISSYFKRSALVLITKPEIKYPKDLVNKKIMAAGIEDFDLNFNYIFSLQNIKIDSLDLVPHSFNVDDFKNGKVDAMTAFISDQPFKLDKLNVKYNIIDPSNFGIFNLQLELFTSKDEVNKNMQRTEAFKKASLQGWEYALNNPDEIINIILKKYNTQNLTKEFLENEALHTERLMLPKMYEIGSIDKMFLYRQIDVLFNKSSFSLDEKKELVDNFIFYNKKELDERKAKLNYELIKNSIPFIFIIILIIFYRQWLLNKYNNKLKLEVLNKTEEYKKQNEELINSNQNFSDLVNTAIEAIAIFDEKDNLVQLNNSGKAMLNCSTLNPTKIINDFIPTSFVEELKEKLKESILEPLEIDLFRSDKSIFPALISAKTIKKDNKQFIIVTIVDLTQIKLRDEFIQQQAKLAQMGELLSMIAHQWRQPLTAISAASENLKLKAILNEMNNETILNTTDDIDKYVNHLNNTINDFRNFYKMNKSVESTTLDELVEKSLNIIEDSIISNNIKIFKELNSSSKIETFISETTQVILSLLQNAEDILLEKQINNPIIKIKTYEDDKKLYLEIIDNGGGISTEILGKIFEPYFSTKHEKNGTGLGLYFAKRIIDNNCNGLLDVKNYLNGAIFTISFNKMK